MTIDVWLQHPTRRFLAADMFASLLRWTGGAIPDEDPPIEATIESMDAAGVDVGLLTSWSGPYGQDLISNDEVAQWVRQHPTRFAGLAAVDLDHPMQAVRELRRRVRDDGFVGLRLLPWLWNAAPTDRRYYPLYAECVELGVPFCTQVGHTGPLRPSETGRPIPYIDQVAIDFPELTIVCGHIGYPWTEEMIAVARKHRERLHRHLGLHHPAPSRRTRRLHEDQDRRPKGALRQQLSDDRPLAQPGGPRRIGAFRCHQGRLSAPVMPQRVFTKLKGRAA